MWWVTCTDQQCKNILSMHAAWSTKYVSDSDKKLKHFIDYSKWHVMTSTSNRGTGDRRYYRAFVLNECILGNNNDKEKQNEKWEMMKK